MADKTEISPEYLRELVEEIIKSPDKVDQLTGDEVIAAKKFFRPLGGTTSATDSFINISITNWRDRYLKKFIATSLVGYLFRLAKEYVPEHELDKEKNRYEAAVKLIDTVGSKATEEKAALLREHQERNKIITKSCNGLINQFLCRHFEYNPDIHVRGSHTINDGDPERKTKIELLKNKCQNAEVAPSIEEKLQAKPDAVYNYLRSHLLKTYQSSVDSVAAINSALLAINDPSLSVKDVQGILLKKRAQLQDTINDMAKIVKPLADKDTLESVLHELPADFYYHFDRYTANHYEQLREITESLYDERPDIEFSILYHGTFKSAEAAQQDLDKHADELRVDAFTVKNSIAHLLGPFKENRQRTNYYNTNTKIIQEMNNRIELDHKLGQDIMKKKVKNVKTKNIAEMGPDHPNLKEYSSNMNIARELGAKQILTQEEQVKLAEAHKKVQEIKEDFEVPDDAIQVDVFFPQENEEGEISLKKTKIFSQSEAPLHLQDGSEYVGKYQPARDENCPVEDACVTKTIVSKKGEKRQLVTRK